MDLNSNFGGKSWGLPGQWGFVALKKISPSPPFYSCVMLNILDLAENLPPRNSKNFYNDDNNNNDDSDNNDNDNNDNDNNDNDNNDNDNNDNDNNGEGQRQ